MQSFDFSLNTAQKSFRNIIKDACPNPEKPAFFSSSSSANNLSTYRSSNLTSFTDLDIDPDSFLKKNSSINSDQAGFDGNTSSVMVCSAYPDVMQNINGYIGEFTHESNNFDVLLKEAEKVETQSSNSSSLSKSSKKICKATTKENLENLLPAIRRRNKGKKHPWQVSEDAKVLELVGQYGQSWALIAAALGNRTGKQVRDRYLNYLRPDIKDDGFSIEEDRMLLTLYYQLGHKWSKIASHMPGRTECQVKNRFYAHIKKRLTFSDFSDIAAKHQQPVESIYISYNNNNNDSFEAKYEDSLSNEESDLKIEQFIEKKEEAFINNNNNAAMLQSQPTGAFIPLPGNNLINPISYETPQNLPVNPFSFVNQQQIENQPTQMYNHINPQTEIQTTDSRFEQTHQAYLSMESELGNIEKIRRYEELLRRKKALEFFYKKTLQEMSSLNYSDFGM